MCAIQPTQQMRFVLDVYTSSPKVTKETFENLARSEALQAEIKLNETCRLRWHLKEPKVRWKSNAVWPVTLRVPNSHSDDTHDTREQAEAVCFKMRHEGFGGSGIAFPLYTWVEKVEDSI